MYVFILKFILKPLQSRRLKWWHREGQQQAASAWLPAQGTPEQSSVISMKSKGRIPLPNRMNFWKNAKGGEGSFSIQKFMLQILGTLKGLFEHEIDKKKSNFRVQGVFFQQLY